MFKILAFDLDGTALNSEKKVTARTSAAITRAIDRGIIAIPCTGREVNGIPEDVLAIPGIEYLISNNGAQVVSMPERQNIYSRTIDKNTAIATVLECRELNAFLFASMASLGYLDTKCEIRNDKAVWNRARQHFKSWNIPSVDLFEYISANDDPIYKFALVIVNEKEHEIIWDRFFGRPGIDLTSSGENNIEIMSPGTSKGAALKYICSRLGVDLKDVMAVGDNLNDIEMIEEAGYSVAMGNSAVKLAELADSVTLSCDEDGLAIAIERIILNENL